MEVAIPSGWDQDSHTLYLHPSGVRIERRVYRHKESWILVPVDLDQAVREFTPNSDGLGLAFAAFAGGDLSPKVAESSGKETLARAAARRDEKLEDASDDEERSKEDEEDED